MSGYIISMSILTVGIAYTWITSRQSSTIDGIPPVEVYISSMLPRNIEMRVLSQSDECDPIGNNHLTKPND